MIKHKKRIQAKPISGKGKAAFILGVIASALIAINTALVFVFYFMRNSILIYLNGMPAGTFDAESMALFTSILTTHILLVYALIWLVITAAIIWATCAIKKRKVQWYIPMIIGVVACIFGRIETGLLIIIASALYK